MSHDSRMQYEHMLTEPNPMTNVCCVVNFELVTSWPYQDIAQIVHEYQHTCKTNAHQRRFAFISFQCSRLSSSTKLGLKMFTEPISILTNMTAVKGNSRATSVIVIAN